MFYLVFRRAVIDGDVSGSVIEDDALTASGQLDIADDDVGEAFFEAATVRVRMAH